MILTCPQCQTRYQTDAARFGADGRNVRCAKCGNTWHQLPEPPPAPVPEPAPPPAEETAPVPVAETVAAPETVAEPVAEPAPSPVAEEPAPPVPVAVPTPPQRRTYAYTDAAPSMTYAPSADASPDVPSSSPRGDRVRAAAGWVGLVALVVALSWSVIHFREAIAMLWPKTATFYAALGRPVNTRGLEIRDVHTSSDTENGQQVLAITGRLANITSHELSVPPIRITLTDDDKRVLYDWSFSAAVATLKPGEAVNFATRLTGPPLGARHMQVQFADSKE